MPEEVLKYKVQIDSSDVAEQLQSIRNQVDLAMGSLAAQQEKPTTFSKIAEAFQPANITQLATDFQKKFDNDITKTMSTMTQQLDRTAERMQLGFGRFTADARRMGLLAPVNYPTFEVPLPDMGIPSDVGVIRNLTSAFGLGYDPQMAMTALDYRSAHSAALNQHFANFTRNSGVTAAGALVGGAVGAFGGLAGAAAGGIIGAGIGLLGQGAVDVITAEQRRINQVAGGLAEISAQNVIGGPSVSPASMDMFRVQARGMFDFASSLEGRMLQVTPEEMQNQLLSFNAVGGFNRMGPGAFQSAIQDLPFATRTLSQGGNLPQADASALLGDMTRLNLGGENLLQTSATALNLISQAGLYGATPGQLLGTGMQGIMATQGSGVIPANAFNQAIDVRGMMSAGYFSGGNAVGNFVNQFSGDTQTQLEQASYSMFEGNMRYAMTPMGMARTANILGGGSPTSNVMDAMSGAAGFFAQDPANLLSTMAMQGNVMGSQNALMNQISPTLDAVNFMQMAGFTQPDGRVSGTALAGFMMQTGLAPNINEAMARVEMADQGASPFISNNILAFRDSMQAIDNVNVVSPFRSAITRATQPFVDVWRAATGDLGRAIDRGLATFQRTVTEPITEFFTGIRTTHRTPIRGGSREFIQGLFDEGVVRVNEDGDPETNATLEDALAEAGLERGVSYSQNDPVRQKAITDVKKDVVSDFARDDESKRKSLLLPDGSGNLNPLGEKFSQVAYGKPLHVQEEIYNRLTTGQPLGSLGNDLFPAVGSDRERQLVQIQTLKREFGENEEITGAISEARRYLTENIGEGTLGEEAKSLLSQAAGVTIGGTDDLTNLLLGDLKGAKDSSEVIKFLKKRSFADEDAFMTLELLTTAVGGLESRTISLNGNTHSIKDVVNLKNAVDFSGEILDDLNGLRSILPDSLAGDATVTEVIEEIAISERLSGKTKQEIMAAGNRKHLQLSLLAGLEQKKKLSSDLAKELSSDVIRTANDLAEAIDYDKQFAGMDKSIQEAGTELAALQFYLTGNSVNKLLQKALDGTGDTRLAVKATWG